MLFIETTRLKLIPLTLHELNLLASSRGKMEDFMGFQRSSFKLNTADSFLKEFESALHSWFIPKVAENPNHYAWFTHWVILEKATHLTVGGIGARGLTDESGQNMIGYFIEQKSEGKGYATEATLAFTRWMFENDLSLREILADTLTDGYASQKVLRKAGFIHAGETDEGLRWILFR